MTADQGPTDDETTVVWHRPTAHLRGGAEPPGSPRSDPRRARAAEFARQGTSGAGRGGEAQPSAETRGGARPDPLAELPPPVPIAGPRSSLNSTPDHARSGLQLLNEPGAPEDALLAAALPVLVVVAQLRDGAEFARVEALRQEVTEQMQKFDERAIKFGAKAADISAARYVLCSLMDETVMTTPWGSASNWSANSLLNHFHGETWGGEKVFAILERVRSEPQKMLALLKLIDMALSLGFEGVYRVRENGRELLEELRASVGRQVSSYTSEPPAELSGHWRGVQQHARRLRRYMPLWAVFAAAGLITAGFYGTEQLRLANALSPVRTQLDRLGMTFTP